jgi:uncharacterized membrane protein
VSSLRRSHANLLCIIPIHTKVHDIYQKTKVKDSDKEPTRSHTVEMRSQIGLRWTLNVWIGFHTSIRILMMIRLLGIKSSPKTRGFCDSQRFEPPNRPAGHLEYFHLGHVSDTLYRKFISVRSHLGTPKLCTMRNCPRSLSLVGANMSRTFPWRKIGQYTK